MAYVCGKVSNFEHAQFDLITVKNQFRYVWCLQEKAEVSDKWIELCVSKQSSPTAVHHFERHLPHYTKQACWRRAW